MFADFSEESAASILRHYLLLTSCLLGLFFDPEDESSKFFQNVGKFVTH
jgi:hypothetical protein